MKLRARERVTKQRETTTHTSSKHHQTPLEIFVFQCLHAALDFSCVSAARDVYVVVPPGLLVLLCCA